MFRSPVPHRILLIVSMLLLAACSKEETPADVLTDAGGPLRYVDADTPYLFAMLEPLPEDFYDKVEPRVTQLMQSYRDIFRLSLQQKLVESEDGEALSQAQTKQIEAIVNRVTGLFTAAGMRDAGFDRDSTVMLYGKGLLPVLRASLSDVAAFEKTMADIEAETDSPLQTAEIDGTSYRYGGNDDVRLVIAVIDEQVVASVVPGSLSDDSLKEIFGITMPARPMSGTTRMQDLAKSYGFSAHGSGFVDFARIVDTFVEKQTGINAELLALTELDREPLSDVCKAEIRGMASIAPRLVSGYTELNDERMASMTVLELRKDIADGLATLPALVPGLGKDHGGLFSFGVSIDLLAAREFYAARLDAMQATPYKCELFAELQAGVTRGKAALEQPVPPIVYGLRGFLAVVDNVDGIDIATKQPPSQIDMRFLLATDNAPGLVAMGTMFSPELAMLNLQPDGKPVRFESPLLQAPVDEAWLAMTDNGLAVAVGDGAQSKVGGMLQEPAGSPPPVLSMHMDASRYYSLIGDTMALQPDEAVNPELNDAVRNMMQILAQLIDRVSMAINFTDRGIEIPAVTTLRE